MFRMGLPIACTLSEAELRHRRQAIAREFEAMEAIATELPNGYAYTVAATSEALLKIVHLVDMERKCCSFLTFKIVIEAGEKWMQLEVTGPTEAKAVIAEYFNS